MAKYKLLALDMDGTLLNEALEVTPETAKWIAAAREAGVTVSLSTGRGYQNAISYAEMLQLQSPMITANGSEVWKAPDQLLYRRTLDGAVVQKLYELAESHGTWFWGYTPEGLFNKEKWTDRIAEQEWTKFGYYSEDRAALSAIWEELAKWEGLEVTNSAPVNIEINPAGVSKASGLRSVCELMGIGMDQVVAVGDSLNDLAAIRAVGLGVAMGNAQDVVKENADVIVATNEEDGVAQVIREYILN
ncbi:Cof-type HAD-IIB family hydrolase [Paenibacillus sp. MSJ-34]|uniref:Cof-type HAD-IIB family hydrolase n=1 Tax=Paenibacillus sp. MSJ-34 TaxID=2841529 RepID=UPI001C0F9F70|nr:Cof-type HAD-IIB family hydrolase [Paenibacillus sp. MSJ-34]MBU5441458.1 Cof-type HAD-IIB family hydrolase [Paenibacillus sp. MSJ-34]